MLFIGYPKCSTCNKAYKFLQSKTNDVTYRDIKQDHPTFLELETWIKLSGKDINKFFNTSGNLYKSMNLKEKLPLMSNEEKLKLLSSDGMLVKRPILIDENQVLVGFKEEEYNQLFKEA